MMKRPNPFLWLPLAGLLKISAFLQGNRLTNKIKIQKPAIILSNHASFHDYVFVTAAVYPHRVTYMAAAKMFHEPNRRPFLKLARSIPICSFQGDVRAVATAFQILKKGGIIGIFPEGQIAYHGASLKPPFSIAKFLKKAGVNVYIIKNQNAYLMAPPWTNKIFKGKVLSSMQHLFTPEQLNDLDEEAIFERVEKGLYFDAGAFNKVAKYRYRVNDIANLENLIYQCPHCGFEGLEAKKNKLVCPKCHHELVYDEYGLLGGLSVFENYERQRIALEKEIEKQPNYSLSSPVELVRYHGDGLLKSGEGIVTLNRDAYTYRGTDNGQDVEYIFGTKHIQYLPTDIGFDIQIYDKYEVYQFYMKDKHLPTVFATAGEYFYRLKNKE